MVQKVFSWPRISEMTIGVLVKRRALRAVRRVCAALVSIPSVITCLLTMVPSASLPTWIATVSLPSTVTTMPPPRFSTAVIPLVQVTDLFGFNSHSMTAILPVRASE